MTTEDTGSTARQRKTRSKAKAEAEAAQETTLVPDADLPSENEDNLFAGTPAEKVRANAERQQDDEAGSKGRKDNSREKKKKKKSRKNGSEASENEDGYSPWLDILRVLTFLVVASCGLSYVMSGGESWTWGYNNKPRFMRPGYWERLWYGPIYLTPAELVEYDGTDPDKPIYLAINHTIFDVSSNARVYGPGGSYNVFAGYDASRGFVTGCFAEDRTPDMRGVEEMFLPLDDAETDSFWSYAELEEMRKQEREAAEKKVYDSLKHWVDFFGTSAKYLEVGKVKLPEDWEAQTPERSLCERAQKGRKRRKLPHEIEEDERRKAEKKERKRAEKEEKFRRREQEKKEEAARG